MKNLFILLLITVCFSAQAQKLRYTDKRNHWITKGGHGDAGFGCTWTSFISFGSDTQINGRVYQRLIDLTWQDASMSCGGISIDSTDLYIREDTTLGIVYSHSSFIYPSVDYDTVEHVLFNYNLQLGDTVHNNYYDILQTDSVISVDSTLINGVYHKTWGFQTIFSNIITYPSGYGYIEGFGSCNSPYYPFSHCFEGSENVVCFYQDSNYIPVQTVFWDCSYFDSINTISGCASVSVHDVNKFIAAVSIAPNPASEEIKISVDHGRYKTLFLSIYNMQGRVVCSSNISVANKDATINCSSWPEGIYLVVVQTDDGILKKEKIVVHR